MAAPRIRPMQDADVAAVDRVAAAAFSALDARMGDAPYQAPSPALAAVRVRRLLATDPGGAWVAERDGEVIGSALALVREGLWGLSRLAVAPGEQSAGIGRELLARAWEHGRGARGFVILGSRDPRALRAYVRLGLALEPALDARGVPRPGGDVPDMAAVRPWREADHAWAGDVGRAVRGAAHGRDLDALREGGATLTALPGRGYAAAAGTRLKLLAASDEPAACALLAAHLAAARGRPVAIEWLTGRQQWAIAACTAAGLDLSAHGAVLTGGDVGPLAPYLPSGAYL
jgi:predicted N-acetyltransferase YhbS